jgi:molybdate transport system substrate-binding protein
MRKPKPRQCPHFCAVPSAISLGLFFAFALVTATHAAELKVLTARAIATVLHEIGPEFERTSGHMLTVVSGLSTQFLTMINSGEPFEVVVTASPIVDGLIKNGKVIADTRVDLGRSGIGVEVRAGAPKPDISSVEAFKRALLNAKSIGYLKVGSGIYLAALLDRLGIAEAIAPKVRRPDTDIVSELVAKGEIELGMVVITQIMTTPGVELVGPLPSEIQSYVTFTGGVSANAKAPDAARELPNSCRDRMHCPSSSRREWSLSADARRAAVRAIGLRQQLLCAVPEQIKLLPQASRTFGAASQVASARSRFATASAHSQRRSRRKGWSWPRSNGVEVHRRIDARHLRSNADVEAAHAGRRVSVYRISK